MNALEDPGSNVSYFQQSVASRIGQVENDMRAMQTNLQLISVSLSSHLAHCAAAETDRNRRLSNLEKLVGRAVLAIAGAACLTLVSILVNAAGLK